MDYQMGDQDAVGVLFQRYNKPVFNFALRMLMNRADAEDVTGDVFLILFSKKYTYNPQAKFSTWLFTVVRNNCIDKIRKRKKMTYMWFRKNKDHEMEEWDPSDNRDIPSDQLLHKEEASMVKAAIKKLPWNQREALILREYQKLNYEEISKILNCSLENVKILIFRARERLRQELSSFIKEDE